MHTIKFEPIAAWRYGTWRLAGDHLQCRGHHIGSADADDSTTIGSNQVVDECGSTMSCVTGDGPP
ncbi:hypothetical protein [Nocardia neocaledoniensis]|uniref:hypothetical protein n=1 Tax=Nocardia neocaledoniensis TaxID=236511 RepID=UPI0024563C9E|nr:hypothetical protein [Nocardia neocaledoniensis]